jgi:predicted GIY-YIG superfamily endonuclease
MKYYVYVLKSLNYNEYYLGSKTDLVGRLKLHITGR